MRVRVKVRGHKRREDVRSGEPLPKVVLIFPGMKQKEDTKKDREKEETGRKNEKK